MILANLLHLPGSTKLLYELLIMKKTLIVFIILNLISQSLYSQSNINQGKPLAEIFTDFHYPINDTSVTNGFALTRAFLGYKFLPAENFSSTIIINIGTPEDLPLGSEPKRYAYFREASIAYNHNNLTINFGIATIRTFDFQQRFWGKRYIAPEYQSHYGYGFVADLGIVMDYIINDIFKFDLCLLNGEGYTNIQMDNSLKTTAGLTITPGNKIAIRLYGDIMKPGSVWQSTLIAFAGFKNDVMTFGAEASYKSNIDLTEGHNSWGISATGSVSLTKNYEVFGRYDYATSVNMPGDILQWNYENDGSFAIAGLQRTFSTNLKMALSYRKKHPADSDSPNSDAIYLNASFRF